MRLIRTLRTAAAFLTAASAGLTAAQPAKPPNIIVIIADDMGWGDAGFNGCKDIPTPAIDSIASGGIRFAEGYVMAPQCAPSRSALLTGKDQNRILANSNVTLDIVGLPDGPTFANFLKQAGYRTGMVGKWHLGTEQGKHPMDRGFDSFFGFLGGGSFYFPQPGRQSIANILDGRKPATVNRYLTDEFGDQAVKFINESGERPFFLYLAFNAPHTPLQAPEERIAEFQSLKSKGKHRPVYAAMVSVMDQNIRKVLDALRARGIDHDTIVVFLSDNGGPPAAKTGADNGPLRGVKGDTLEGGIRVPFALQWPAKIKPGRTVSTPVVSMDLLPTALAAAGRPIPADLEGVNLLPMLLGDGSLPPRVLNFMFASTPGKPESWWWAVRDGDWKLAYFDLRENGRKASATGLFNIREDPAESKDLSASNPEVRDRLRKAHDAWFGGLPEPYGNVPAAALAEFLEKKRESKTKRKSEGEE
jgi:arylsulfatase A-like enzyme